MNLKISHKQKYALLKALPETLLDAESIAHLSNDIRFMDEEIVEPSTESWILSFAALMAVTLGMFVILYSFQSRETNPGDNGLIAKKVQKLTFENQNLHVDLAIAKSQIDDLLVTRQRLDAELKTHVMKIDELQRENRRLHFKR